MLPLGGILPFFSKIVLQKKISPEPKTDMTVHRKWERFWVNCPFKRYFLYRFSRSVQKMSNPEDSCWKKKKSFRGEKKGSLNHCHVSQNEQSRSVTQLSHTSSPESLGSWQLLLIISYILHPGSGDLQITHRLIQTHPPDSSQTPGRRMDFRGKETRLAPQPVPTFTSALMIFIKRLGRMMKLTRRTSKVSPSHYWDGCFCFSIISDHVSSLPVRTSCEDSTWPPG